MPDLDPLSRFDKELLSESWYVELDDYIIDIAWSPDTTLVAAVTVEGGVYLIEDHGESAEFALVGQHDGGANSVSWRCDGAEFATAGHDGLVKIWDGATGNGLAEFEAGDLWVGKAIYSPRSNLLATGAGKHLRLWNESREVVYESSEHSSTIADIGWNPDGSGIAVAAYNGVTLHVPGKQKQPRKYVWKGSSLMLAWSPDAKYIATGEQDSTVHFWHVKSGEDAQMSGFQTKVLELSWDASGQWLATGGGHSICLWDCSGPGPMGRAPLQCNLHRNKITQLAFQPDGKYLVSADVDSALMLWDPMKHQKIIGGGALSSPASCLLWCSNGKLAVGQHDGIVVIFKVRS